jgi:aminocarboxymuconate-semialdehyde decarboxylase
VKTVDIHAHCAVLEALALLGHKLAGPQLHTDLDMVAEVALRIKVMDDQGIDVEALSINPTWYGIADRDLAKQIIDIQNEKLAEACGRNPDRFVAFASVALQFPDLAAEQLEQGVKRYGLRGAAIGRRANGGGEHPTAGAERA